MSKKYPISLALIIVGLVLSAINMRSPIVIIGSVADVLMGSLGLSAAQIGYLGALPMPLFAFGAMVAPRFARRFGLENMILGMTALLTVGVASRVWFGVAGLFVGTFVLSFAIGMLNALIAPFIKKHAPNHIALATGIFSLSMSVFAGVVAWLVVPVMAVMSWQMAMSGLAVFGLFSLMIWGVVWHATPSSIPTTPSSQTVFRAWRSADAWYMGLFMGIQSLLFYTVASFLPSIGVGYGMTSDRASELALMFQIVAPLAIVVLTVLMKRNFSIKIIALTSAMLNAIGTAGLLWLPEYLHLWSAVMGFGGAAIFTLSLMLFSVRTSSLQSAQELSGMVQAVGYGVAFFGPLVLGKLFEKTGTWELSLQVLFGLMCLNVMFAWLAGCGEKVD